MYQQPRPNPEIDIDKLLESLKRPFQPILNRLGGGSAPVLFFLILIAALVIWLSSGLFQVEPAERAAIQLFGSYVGEREAGLHWFWPRPIGTVTKAVVTETQRLEVGFRSLSGGGSTDVPSEAIMITGDLNIADVQMVVQYRIDNLFNYLFQVADPGDPQRGVRAGSPSGMTLKDASEAALRQVVGQRSIDDVLTINREAIQQDTLQLLRRIMTSYNSGVLVLEVRLQNVRPPDQVRDAFDDVVRARVDKEAAINQALAYQQDQVPRARGDAERITNAAQAFKQERVLRATGESDRFLSVLREYRDSKDVTRQRLYLEAMEEILPGIQKFVVNPDAGGNMLQFLDLTRQNES
ncbi:MAG: FtsH protease activity modulator HflK [Chloroflexi bacterium]|nr:FtsH protease activity modulator HflK [Chloroflexota bacterium]